MSRPVFDKALAEAAAHGVKSIRLYSTAEPTLHPDFDEYVGELKRRQFDVGVSTNASSLMEHFDSLASIDDLQFSIDGWDKLSYEQLRAPLKFDKIHLNVEQFWKRIIHHPKRPAINCNLLLTRSADLQAFVDCWGPFVDTISLNFLLGTTHFEGGHFHDRPNPEMLSEYLEHTTDFRQVCAYPFNSITVAFDGKIAPCCSDFAAELPMGNILNGIAQSQQSASLASIRSQFYTGRVDICTGCSFFMKPSPTEVRNIEARLASVSSPWRHKLRLPKLQREQ